MEVITEEDVKDISQTELKHMLKERAAKVYEAKESEFPEPEHMREIERVVLLKVIDANGWIISMIWISCVRESVFRLTVREIQRLSTR